MQQTAIRHRSADVAVGYSADRTGNGIAYLAIATGSGRTVAKVPFSAAPLAALDGREFGYAAVAAAGGYLRGHGFSRVRLRLADDGGRRRPQRPRQGPARARDGLRQDALRAARLRGGARRTRRTD